MKIKEFIEKYKNSKVQNTKITNAVSEYLRKELEIKDYIPFSTKRDIAETIVEKNISEVDGFKKYDSVGAYISLIMDSIVLHTNLEVEDQIVDYDLLAESGLLPQILALFQGSYDELGTILKMVVAMELEDNNVNVSVGRFLNKISGALDGVLEILHQKLDGFDIQKALGVDFNDEDLTKLFGFLNKIQ